MQGCGVEEVISTPNTTLLHAVVRTRTALRLRLFRSFEECGAGRSGEVTAV